MKSSQSTIYVVTIGVALATLAIFLVRAARLPDFVEYVGPGQLQVNPEWEVYSAAWLDDCNDDQFPELALILGRVDRSSVEGIYKLLYSGRDGALLQQVDPIDMRLVMCNGIVGIDRRTGSLVDSLLINGNAAQARVGEHVLPGESRVGLAEVDQFTFDPIEGSILNFVSHHGVLSVSAQGRSEVLLEVPIDEDSLQSMQWLKSSDAEQEVWHLIVCEFSDPRQGVAFRIRAYSWPGREQQFYLKMENWFPIEMHFDLSSNEFKLLCQRETSQGQGDGAKEAAWMSDHSPLQRVPLPGSSLLGSGFLNLLRIPWAPSMTSMRLVNDPLLHDSRLECWDSEHGKRKWLHRPSGMSGYQEDDRVFFDWLSDHNDDGHLELGIRLRSGTCYVLDGATGQRLRANQPNE